MFGFGRRKRKREEEAAKAAAEEAAKKLAEEATADESEIAAETPAAEAVDSQPIPQPEEQPAVVEEPPSSSETEQEKPIEAAVEETTVSEEAANEPLEEALPADTAEVTEPEPAEDAPEGSSGEASDTSEAAIPDTPMGPATNEAEAPEPEQETPTEATQEKKPGFFGRLKERLTRTRGNFADGLANLVLGRKEIDDELLEELETMLLVADVGVEATTRIINDLNHRVRRKELSDPSALSIALKTQLQSILEQCDKPVLQPTPGKPQVILMVGINGAGKTTTIGKLAKRLQEEGNSVMLAAGDTFRAAAVEQLQTWGERNNIPVIAQHTGADSASVIFDGLQAATARGADVLIADTAGRLHTKSNLMDELAKIARVMQKIDPEAPHEVMLVVDATTGQNALNQALQFNETIPLTGITLTKLDGTAKGGILFAIADRMHIPIRFIGVGEAIEDLRYFKAKEFVDALFEE